MRRRVRLKLQIGRARLPAGCSVISFRARASQFRVDQKSSTRPSRRVQTPCLCVHRARSLHRGTQERSRRRRQACGIADLVRDSASQPSRTRSGDSGSTVGPFGNGRAEGPVRGCNDSESREGCTTCVAGWASHSPRSLGNLLDWRTSGRQGRYYPLSAI